MRLSLAIIALSAGVWLLREASAVFVPIAVALVLFFILRPITNSLTALGVPKSAGAFVVFCVFAIIAFFGVTALSESAKNFATNAPEYLKPLIDSFPALDHVVSPDSSSNSVSDSEGTSISSTTSSSENVNANNEELKKSTTASFVSVAANSLQRLASASFSAFSTFLTTLILLLFLLTSGDSLIQRLIALWSSIDGQTDAEELKNKITADISRYAGVLSLINIGIAIVCSSIFWLLDVPSPVLLGIIAGLLNFAPYIGPVIMLSILTLVAIASTPSYLQAALVPLSFLFVSGIEGTIITPMLQSKSLSINPVVVFLSILIASWCWGFVGTFIAIPLITSILVVAQYSPKAKPIVDILKHG